MVLRSGTVGIPERINMYPATAASPKDIPENERLIHLVEIKYCETLADQVINLKPLNDNTKICENQLKGKSVLLHTILLGVGGSIYSTHTLKHFTDLGLNPQRSRKLAYSLHEHCAICL